MTDHYYDVLVELENGVNVDVTRSETIGDVITIDWSIIAEEQVDISSPTDHSVYEEWEVSYIRNTYLSILKSDLPNLVKSRILFDISVAQSRYWSEEWELAQLVETDQEFLLTDINHRREEDRVQRQRALDASRQIGRAHV